MSETIMVNTRCMLCSEPDQIEVDKEQYDKWHAGINIQYAMPDVSADVREQLISGICPSCFKVAFGSTI